MNTTAKGNAFEERALNIIQRMIEEKRIAVMADAYTIKKQAPYYSHQRQGNIKFDLTIEVQPPGAGKYSFIYIIECKDYKTSISIDRLEAFCKKIEQIAPRNSKAIFITTSKFQKSAENFANSQGVMLVGVNNENQYNIILYNKSIDNLGIDFFNKQLINLDVGEKILEKEIDTTILQALQNIRGSNKLIRSYSKEDIEDIANEVLNHIDDSILNCEKVLSIGEMVRYANDILKLKIRNTSSKDMFGCFNFTKNTIEVSHELYSSKRYKFVLAHEIGHCVMHADIVIESDIINIMSDSEYNFRTGKRDLLNEKNWMEWQANYFATCLTMPKVPFTAMLLEYQMRFGTREGHIYLDDQPENVRCFIKIIGAMSIRLQLSRTCIINRLKELNMLTDNSKLKSIGQIMNDYQSQLVI